jgi:hypothetical protein
MSENAIRELRDSELNEVTGGFADPWSVLIGATAVGIGYLAVTAAEAGAFDAVPYGQYFDK